eukprot:270156_1
MDKCTPVVMTLSVLMTIITLSLTATVIYAFKKLFLSFKEEKLGKKVKIFCFIFLISTCISLFLWGIVSSGECYGWHDTLPPVIVNTYAIGFVISYVIQSITLLLIFFNRILNVFNNTRFKLTKCTKRTYDTLFSIEVICGIMMIIVYICLPGG